MMISRMTACLCLAAVVGCGGAGDYPDMGEISGRVTMDGKPLPDALVTFTPTGSRPSSGVTDENGFYELIYSAQVKGAKSGEHVVSISTYLPPGPGDDGMFSEGTPETVPVQYNSKSVLIRKVTGNETMNFELESSGEIDTHEEDKEISEEDF